MAKTRTALIALAAVVCAGALASAEDTPAPDEAIFRAPGLQKLQQVTTGISAECRSSEPAFEGRGAALYAVRKAIREKRPIKVLAIGSSSTVGVGASSPVATYPVRLEHDLEGFLSGLDVEMVTRGISGEVAEAAAERLKLEVAEAQPDLVVWQVGTNDAMARVAEDEFTKLLSETIEWLKSKRVDVVIIDPQYVERLANDTHYNLIVQKITDVARASRVLLVHRYSAMADLSRKKSNASYLAADRFHLNDLGYRCMAEYAARAIVAGLINAETDPSRVKPLN